MNPIERYDEIIEQAEKQRKTAVQAQKRGYEKLKDRVKAKYEEKIKELHCVKDCSFQVKHSYESTDTSLYINFLPTEEKLETYENLREIDDLDASWSFKAQMEEKIEDAISELDELDTSIYIRFCTEKEFERRTDK